MMLINAFEIMSLNNLEPKFNIKLMDLKKKKVQAFSAVVKYADDTVAVYWFW